VLGIFKIGSLRLFAWAGLQLWILLISASQVARITGVSHQYLAHKPSCNATVQNRLDRWWVWTEVSHPMFLWVNSCPYYGPWKQNIKITYQVSQKIKIELLYNIAITFLGMSSSICAAIIKCHRLDNLYFKIYN
jgi:hypothetical protein